MLSDHDFHTLMALKNDRSGSFGNLVAELRMRNQATTLQEVRIYGYATKKYEIALAGQSSPQIGPCRTDHEETENCIVCGHYWEEHNGHICDCCDEPAIGAFISCRTTL